MGGKELLVGSSAKEKLDRWRWLVIVAVAAIVTAALAWGTWMPTTITSTGECWTLASVPGPEDLVLVPTGDTALVSSQDRRVDPEPAGAIWSVPLDPARSPRRPRPLELRGRDGCSFHPHGIDLVNTRRGSTLLYVINHHQPEDLGVARACFDAVGKTEPGASVTSVEVFELRDGELYFLQRLAAPEILTGGNDLVAEDDGDLWVTIPPSSVLDLVPELFGAARSKLVRFECESGFDHDARCTGSWSEVRLPFEAPPQFINGIEIDRDSRPGRLYLASTGDERILVAAIEPEGDQAAPAARKRAGGPPSLGEVGFHCVDGKPDNLRWSENGELLVAVHADARRFLQHAGSPRTASPWKVFSLSAADPPASPRCEEREPLTPVLEDAGGRVSAASVAASIEGDLVVGQVFGPGVARCRPDLLVEPQGALP